MHMKQICICMTVSLLKGDCSVWMKTMHYPNTIRSHLVTIVDHCLQFTPKSTSKLRSALHIRYNDNDNDNE